MWKLGPFTHDGGGQGCLPPAFLLPKLEGEPIPPREPRGPSTMFAVVSDCATELDGIVGEQQPNWAAAPARRHALAIAAHVSQRLQFAVR